VELLEQVFLSYHPTNQQHQSTEGQLVCNSDTVHLLMIMLHDITYFVVRVQKTNAALKSFGAFASKKFGEMR